MLHRTIFLSDIHLGTPGCQAELLIDFLRHNDAQTIYLVGDIVDGWRLKRGWHWPPSHSDVVQTLLSKAKNGARIIYIPGNHDESLRDFLGMHFAGIEVALTSDHVAADQRRYLVTHGDQFDAVILNARWLALLGDRAYDVALWFNTRINRIRHLWGGRYLSLSKWAKAQVKQAVSYIGEYEKLLATEARRGGYDGVICGHIHSAELKKMGSFLYLNTGDWVESCTAIVESEMGHFTLLDWSTKTLGASAHHADDVDKRPLYEKSRRVA